MKTHVKQKYFEAVYLMRHLLPLTELQHFSLCCSIMITVFQHTVYFDYSVFQLSSFHNFKIKLDPSITLTYFIRDFENQFQKCMADY